MGYQISHSFFFLYMDLNNTIQFLGISFNIATYDDRFHVGLIADKTLLCKDKAQVIADIIFDKILALYKEINSSKNNYYF